MKMEKPKMAPNIARIALPLVALPLAFYAASGTPVSAADKDFGCTVRQNIETQTVNMDPRYEGTLMEGGLGIRSAAAVRRYMTDKIRPLAGAGMGSDVGRQGGAMADNGMAVTGQGK